ncbi:hypothetical protein RB595_003563 [Gaeumannomyces hyphopodioides]
MQWTTLLAVVVASAQLIMAAPVETNLETATQLATTTSLSTSTAASAATAAVTTWPYFIKNINAALSSASTPSTSTSLTTPAAAATQQAAVQQRGVDHGKKLTDYLNYSTNNDDKLPECCKKCMLETSGRGGTFGMTVNVNDTTMGDFCNYEIRTSTWLRDQVLPCTDNACAFDHPGTSDASQKWMANVCPGKYDN